MNGVWDEIGELVEAAFTQEEAGEYRISMPEALKIVSDFIDRHAGQNASVPLEHKDLRVLAAVAYQMHQIDSDADRGLGSVLRIVWAAFQYGRSLSGQNAGPAEKDDEDHPV
jgi:hypothetical protein